MRESERGERVREVGRAAGAEQRPQARGVADLDGEEGCGKQKKGGCQIANRCLVFEVKRLVSGVVRVETGVFEGRFLGIPVQGLGLRLSVE